MQKRVYLAALMLLMFLLPTGVFSVPSTVSYQGKLTDSSGVPINGNTAIKFSLYSVETGGTAVWSENYDGNSGRPIINVVNGHFSVELGSITSLSKSVFSASSIYLGIKVGSDSEMSPRIPILSSPFAFQSENADTLDDLHASSFLRTDTVSSGAHKLTISVNTATDWAMRLIQSSSTGYGLEVETASTGTEPAIKVTQAGSSIFRVQGNGKVGIGVSTASEALEVNGTIKATNFLDSDGNSIVSVDQIWNRDNASSPTYFNGYNVGIGTTSPTHKLTLQHEGGEDGIKIMGNTNESSVALGTSLELESNIDYRGRGVLMTHRNPIVGDKSMWYMGVPYTGNGFQIAVSDVKSGTLGPAFKDQSVLLITEAGLVGIGTSTPTQKLTVNGDAILGEVKLGSTTYDGSYAVFQHKDAADYGFIHDSNGRALINSAAGQAINLRIANQTKLSVDATGKTVAYGTLEVGDGTNGELLALNSVRPWVFEATGTGAGTQLVLRPKADGKKFAISSEDKSNTLFFVDTANAPSEGTVSLLGSGGRLLVGPGSDGDSVLNVSGNARVDGVVKGTTFEGAFSGDGSDLVGLNASSLASGTVALTRLPSIPNSKLSSGAALDNLGGDVDEVEELFLSKTGVWKQPSQLSSAKIAITEDELKRTDEKNLILDGLEKQMVFKTRDQVVYPQAGTGVTAAAFLWMYGGNEKYNQLMYLNNFGDVWTKKYGLLQDFFMTRAQADVITENVTFGDAGFSMTTEGAARFGSINLVETTMSGVPANDGFRMRYDADFFGTNTDALLFEKTDMNQAEPDGGIVFVNTGTSGTPVVSMVIRGDGKVGIGTTAPSESLDVNGTVKATAFSGAIDAGDISSGTLAIERLSGNSVLGSVNKFLNEKGDWEVVNVTVGMADTQIPVYNGSNLVASSLVDDGSTLSITNRNVSVRKTSASSLVASFVHTLDQAVGVELRSEGGNTTFIDFSRNDTEDYSVRLSNNADGLLSLSGDLYVSGEIGIGTSEPSQKLHVVGTALFNKTRFESTGYWEKMVIQTNDPETSNSSRLYLAGETSAGELSSVNLFFPSQGASFNFESDVNFTASGTYKMAFSNNGAERFAIEADGDVTIANELSVNSIEIRGGADLAEKFSTKEKDIEPGTVMVIDPEKPGRLRVSTRAHDTLVAGIVSGANNLMPGVVLSDDKTLNGTSHPIALSGRVWVKCTDEAGKVKPGDLLTTSSTPGHVMKVTSYSKAQGAIIGKAMSSIQDGFVLVLVSLQ